MADPKLAEGDGSFQFIAGEHIKQGQAVYRDGLTGKIMIVRAEQLKEPLNGPMPVALRNIEAGELIALDGKTPDITTSNVLASKVETAAVVRRPVSMPLDPIEAIRHYWMAEDIDWCGGESVCEQAVIDIETLYTEIVRLRAIIDAPPAP